jgi:hypothetical protein
MINRIDPKKQNLVKVRQGTEEQRIIYKETEIQSAGWYIDLPCSTCQEHPACYHRFHLARNAPNLFDMLLGSDMPQPAKESVASH